MTATFEVGKAYNGMTVAKRTAKTIVFEQDSKRYTAKIETFTTLDGQDGGEVVCIGKLGNRMVYAEE